MIDFRDAINPDRYSFVYASDVTRHNIGDLPDYTLIGTADFPQPHELHGLGYDMALPGRGNDPNGIEASEVGKDRARVGGLALTALGVTGRIISLGNGSPGNTKAQITEAYGLDQVIEHELNPFLVQRHLPAIAGWRRALEEASRTSASNFTEARTQGLLGMKGLIAVSQRAHALRLQRSMDTVTPDMPHATLLVPDDPAYPDTEHPFAGLATYVSLLPIHQRWQSDETMARIARIMDSAVWFLPSMLSRVRGRRREYNQSGPTKP